MRNLLLTGLVIVLLFAVNTCYGQITITDGCNGGCDVCPNKGTCTSSQVVVNSGCDRDCDNCPRHRGWRAGSNGRNRNRGLNYSRSRTITNNTVVIPAPIYKRPAPVRYYSYPQPVLYYYPNYIPVRRSSGIKILGLPILEFHRSR